MCELKKAVSFPQKERDDGSLVRRSLEYTHQPWSSPGEEGLRSNSRDGGVVGEGAEEPERSERAFVAGVVGMRRSEEAKVSEEAVRRKGGGGGPRELGMSHRWGGRV